MSTPRSFGNVLLSALLLLPAAAHPAEALSAAQARHGLEARVASVRLAAVERLGEIGGPADAQRLVARLDDADERVRGSATSALWQIWSRSGDPAIDALFARGLEQMRSVRLEEAAVTFDTVVRRKPAFAEGWNKRATVHYLLGRNAESLRDCAEVLKRNPIHFGALSGAAQNHLALGEPERALAYFRRALKVNPHLENAAEAVQMLEEQLGARRRSTT